MAVKITHDAKQVFSSFIYKFTLDLYKEIIVIQSPFGNCQNFCMKYGYKVLDFNEEEQQSILLYIRKTILKQTLILDIRKEYEPKLDTCFKKIARVRKVHYTNTNTKKPMILCKITFHTKKPE
tara:strand:+ start:41254 stop:41622 length:369 start_codon:yes stop_codon:yes gene_type:complete